MSDPSFAPYLARRGVITQEQLAQLVRARQARDRTLGDIAVTEGILSEEQAKAILAFQDAADLYFGEAAIRMGVLTTQHIRELLEEQKRTRLVVEDFVVDSGFASREAVQAALTDYRAERLKLASRRVGIRWDAPYAWLAADLFDMAVKLLCRVWLLESLPIGTSVDNGTIRLPENRAQARLCNGFDVRFLLGVPNEVATYGVMRMIETRDVSSEECQDATQELANLICGNTSARLARQGIATSLSSPTRAPAEVAAGEEAACVVLSTLYGNVVCAVVG